MSIAFSIVVQRTNSCSSFRKLYCNSIRTRTTTAIITNVFPDASASAAGVRTMTLLERFSSNGGGNSKVHLTAPIIPSSFDLEQKNRLFMDGRANISVSPLPLNRSDEVVKFCKHLTDDEDHDTTSRKVNIIFDRFYVEEGMAIFFFFMNLYVALFSFLLTYYDSFLLTFFLNI